MSKVLLEQGLSKQFTTYTSLCTSQMEEVLSLLESEYQKSLSSCKSALFATISSQDSKIQDLTSILTHYTQLKQNRSTRLYSYFTRQQNSRKLKQIFEEWSKYFRFKKKTKKMNTYVINYYRRGSLRKDFFFWKNEVQIIRREKRVLRNAEILKSEIFKSIGAISEESERLRGMISELTEDLRNETLAKNMLRGKFEGALLRGVSALNSEGASIQQEKYPAFASSDGFRN